MAVTCAIAALVGFATATARAEWRTLDPLTFDAEYRSPCAPQAVPSWVSAQRIYAANGDFLVADRRVGQWRRESTLVPHLRPGEVVESVAVTRTRGAEVVAVLIQRPRDRTLRVLWQAEGSAAWKRGPSFASSRSFDRGGCLFADPGQPERLFFWGARSDAGHHEADTACRADRLNETWRCVDGVFGDGLAFLAANPYWPGELVIADLSGRAFRSDDAGETLHRLQLPISPAESSPCFATEGGAAWLGRSVLALDLGEECGLGLSEDGGRSVLLRPRADLQGLPGGLLFDPFDGGRLVMARFLRDDASATGIRSDFAESRDRGESWQPIDLGLGAHRSVGGFAADPARPFRFVGWVDGQPAVYESLDTSPCEVSPDRACLGGRFELEALWRGFEGSTGVGHAIELSDSTGGFWFFDPANLEVAVRQLDGSAVNGHVWNFLGSLSNVEFRVRVRDTATGLSYGYFNPLGRFASGGDIEALEAEGAQVPAESPSPVSTATAPPIARDAAGPCVVDDFTLCLRGGRFSARGFWRDFWGAAGLLRSWGLSNDTGAFWIYGPGQLEVFVKILDGRPINGDFWLYQASLTNVEFEITVTDEIAGTVRVLHNDLGSFASFGWVEAFPEI